MISSFNNFKLNESKEIDDIEYLNNDFINDYFGDVRDIGYTYGYQGYYRHNKLIVGTWYINKETMEKIPTSFILYFYKIVNTLYRNPSEIIDDINTFNECIEQYRNCDELSDYNFSGIAVRDKGDPNHNSAQLIEIYFKHITMS